jgi:hypothetical protein
VEWAPGERDFGDVVTIGEETEIPPRVLEALCENLVQRSHGIRLPDKIDLGILENAVFALPQEEWVSGRKLRQKLAIEDPAEFQKHVLHLVPRYLRIDPSKEGDYYSPTLAGLFRIENTRTQETLEYLVRALTRRYNLDPDARIYDWADLAAVGLPAGDVRLAWSVASIALLMRGGGMAEGAPPTINLAMPLDAEQIVLACRNKTFAEYVLDAANHARERSQYGPVVDRPWLGAPAYLERDGGLEDYVTLAYTGERRTWPLHRSATVQTGAPPPDPSRRDAAQGDFAPFHLKKIRLFDVRGFTSLEIPLASPASDSGQWMIILGTNGSGKTSILRALTLALSADDQVVQALLVRLGTASPMVRLDAREATIQIECPTGHVPRLRLEESDTGDRLADRGSGEIFPRFVVAYGCRRGSALGGPAREVNAASPLSAVGTLFDEDARLIHAETWLKERKFAALEEAGIEQAFYEAVEATLVGHGNRPGLLPGITALHVGADLVEVEGPAVGRIPFGALSDGYLTTAGWILDLIARWSEEAKRQGVTLDGSFSARMTGIAIVDEIDLHIHPRWQREVISRVREHFPRMTFIVTTHNPLTLLGGRPGEIFVLERDEATGQVAAHQRDLPPGADVERILTGDWFGLPSTLDDQTLELLAEHRRLLRTGAADTPQAKKLEQKLAKRLGASPVTSIEKLAQSAAAKVLGDEARDLSPSDREVALAKIVEIMREESRPTRRRKQPKRKAR